MNRAYNAVESGSITGNLPAKLSVSVPSRQLKRFPLEGERRINMRKAALRSVMTLAGVAAMIVFVCMAAVGCGNRYCRLSEGSVDIAMKSRALHYGTAILESCKKGKAFALNGNATPGMERAFDAERQRSACGQIRARFGDYRSLEYMETLISRGEGYQAFRFRGVFTGMNERPEVRVVLSREGRLAGFWIKPWRESME